MSLDLKKTVEALLMSTSDPLSLKDLLSVFQKYKEQLEAEASAEDAGEDDLILTDTVKKNDLESVLKTITEEAESNDFILSSC